MIALQNIAVPTEPIIFNKFPNTIIASGAPILLSPETKVGCMHVALLSIDFYDSTHATFNLSVDPNFTSINHSLNQSIHPSIHPSINQSITHSINQSITRIFTQHAGA